MGLRTFTFSGTCSSDFNLFITEATVYNVPERAVEMIEIPGRNGAYALDRGRFQNVQVTYHVCVSDVTNSDFQVELSDVRNWLASKIGYQRLEDDYNSGVYRMAVYKGGLETREAFINGAEFDITFECKPQRFLTSGETEQTVTNNGTLTNPTLFDSSPLLAVKGYGNLSFNGYALNIQNAVMGNIYFADGEQFVGNKTYTLDTTLFNSGNTITVSGQLRCGLAAVKSTLTARIGACTDTNTAFETTSSWFDGTSPNYYATTTTSFNVSFTAGTNSTATNTATVIYKDPFDNTKTITATISQTITYTASSGTIAFSTSVSMSTTITGATVSGTSSTNTATIMVNSTKSALGNPTYIDCDIGECYLIQNDEIITLNNVVALGSDLPKLSSGTNTFTFDNTITSLKVTPRYWKV